MPTVKGLLAILYLALNTAVCCVPIYLLAIPRAFVPVARMKVAFGTAMSRVIDTWVGANRVMLRALSLTNVHLSIDVDEPLRRDRWYVVVSNHQGWSDILVLQNTFLDLIPPLNFFVKRQLLWVPLLGFAMWLLGFPYVRRYSREALERDPNLRKHDQEATQRAAEAFKHRPTSVLNFMEGTRFTTDKHRQQQSRYRNLLMPKTGGFGYVIAALGDRVHGILDVTIVYPNGAPSFWEFLCGRCRDVYVEVRGRPVPTLAFEAINELSEPTREVLRGWTDDLWSRKDARIDEMRNGR